ncbi:MAG TPA: hypothetical protein DDZ51_17535 [Planctomycetaceae bacterium]|nr:hypothetical protein [Planctomycetaceae bacterium]
MVLISRQIGAFVKPLVFVLLDLNINVFCVIRSAGERTAGACRKLVEASLPAGRVAVVELHPFETALQECYRLGIESGATWLLTVDADVLLQPERIPELIRAAEAMPNHYVQLEGRIFDKVFGVFRQAGHRVYRVKLLPLALKSIPKPGSELRPEFSTLQELGRLGHPSRRVATVAGVHDFEQWYRDLYRKSFIHARKHRQDIVALVDRATSLAADDADFRVILKGIWDGLIDARSVSIDTNLFTERYCQALSELGLAEKEPLALEANLFGEAWLAQRMEFNPPKMAIFDMPSSTLTETASQRFKRLTEAHGVFRAACYSIASIGESSFRKVKNGFIKAD